MQFTLPLCTVYLEKKTYSPPPPPNKSSPVMSQFFIFLSDVPLTPPPTGTWTLIPSTSSGWLWAQGKKSSAGLHSWSTWADWGGYIFRNSELFAVCDLYGSREDKKHTITKPSAVKLLLKPVCRRWECSPAKPLVTTEIIYNVLLRSDGQAPGWCWGSPLVSWESRCLLKNTDAILKYLAVFLLGDILSEIMLGNMCV